MPSMNAGNLSLRRSRDLSAMWWGCRWSGWGRNCRRGEVKSSLRQFLPEVGAHHLAFVEAIEMEFFVWRMGVVIRQAEAEEQRIRAKDFLELVDDGDGAALTHEDGFVAEGIFQ